MARRVSSFFEKRILRRWEKALAHIDVANSAELKELRTSARALGVRVDKLVRKVDQRLAENRQAKIRRPMQSDWAWRPEIWERAVQPHGMASVNTKTSLGHEAKIFHDCPLNEISVRQMKNNQLRDVAGFGLRIDVYRFHGSFLSVAVDLPLTGIEGLTRRHLIRSELSLRTDEPVDVFGRLNIRHGPNVEQLVRQFELTLGASEIEFDLAATNLDETRVERAWVDIIFENPAMNEIHIADMTLSRRPRAEI